MKMEKNKCLEYENFAVQKFRFSRHPASYAYEENGKILDLSLYKCYVSNYSERKFSVASRFLLYMGHAQKKCFHFEDTFAR